MHAVVLPGLLHNCHLYCLRLTLFAHGWLAVTATIDWCYAVLRHNVICIAAGVDMHLPGPCMQTLCGSWSYRRKSSADELGLSVLINTYMTRASLLKHLAAVWGKETLEVGNVNRNKSRDLIIHQ